MKQISFFYAFIFLLIGCPLEPCGCSISSPQNDFTGQWVLLETSGGKIGNVIKYEPETSPFKISFSYNDYSEWHNDSILITKPYSFDTDTNSTIQKKGQLNIKDYKSYAYSFSADTLFLKENSDDGFSFKYLLSE